MPLISSFAGLLIYMFKEKNMPHFHAKFAEYEAVYDLEGNLLESKDGICLGCYS